jgi:hypothetical protein
MAQETNKNRIMVYGPKGDGTYLVEFRTAAGEVLAISIPRGKPPAPAGAWPPRSMTARAFRIALPCYATPFRWWAVSSGWRSREPSGVPAIAQSFLASRAVRPGTRPLLAGPHAPALQATRAVPGTLSGIRTGSLGAGSVGVGVGLGTTIGLGIVSGISIGSEPG